MRPKKWNNEQLKAAVAESRSVRQVLGKLGLKQAGGNYAQIKKYLTEFKIESKHFTGRGWSKGLRITTNPGAPIEELLVNNSGYQSFKLKRRLFDANLKPKHCEECGWSKISKDGRLPLELDHINGNPRDHRLENLRVLCPNCHSLKPTHRGRNKKHA
jgi:hypothetical protein